MPLRYKKFILIFTLAVMLIGLGTFSLMAPDLKFGLPSASADGVEKALKGKSDADIKKEITELMKGYFDAKLKVDMKELAEYVTDVENMDERKLVAEAEYIENYDNISCTVKKMSERGSYRVYVYHEDKYYDIQAAIPSLTAVCVKIQDDGVFMLHYGTLTGKEQKEINKLDNSSDVKKLKDSVNKKLEELKNSDAEVKEFCEMLESASSNDEEEGTENIQNEAGSANGATQAPVVTQAPQQAATQAPAAVTQAPVVTQPPAAVTQAPVATQAPAQ